MIRVSKANEPAIELPSLADALPYLAQGYLITTHEPAPPDAAQPARYPAQPRKRPTNTDRPQDPRPGPNQAHSLSDGLGRNDFNIVPEADGDSSLKVIYPDRAATGIRFKRDDGELDLERPIHRTARVRNHPDQNAPSCCVCGKYIRIEEGAIQESDNDATDYYCLDCAGDEVLLRAGVRQPHVYLNPPPRLWGDYYHDRTELAAAITALIDFAKDFLPAPASPPQPHEERPLDYIFNLRDRLWNYPAKPTPPSAADLEELLRSAIRALAPDEGACHNRPRCTPLPENVPSRYVFIDEFRNIIDPHPPSTETE